MKTMFQLKKHVLLQVSVTRRFVNYLMTTRFNLIKHMEDKEDLINSVCMNLLILILLIKKSEVILKKISYTLESLPKSSLMIFTDKQFLLANQNTLHIFLLQILLQELTSKEKDYQPYWTPVYKKISEKLLLPTETGCVASDLNSSNYLLKKVAEKSQLLKTKNNIKVQNKNSQKIFYQLSKSTLVNKWENEVTEQNNKLKNLKVRIVLTENQKEILNKWMNTYKYTYNKTLDKINDGHSVNNYNLRTLIVTENTKTTHPEYVKMSNIIQLKHKDKKKIKDTKSEQYLKIIEEINLLNKELRLISKNLESTKNNNISKEDLLVPKCVREAAVNECCSAHKSGMSNLKAGNIKFFVMKYKKEATCISIPKNLIEKKEEHFIISKSFFGKDNIIKMKNKSRKKYKDIKIEKDIKFIYQQKKYYFLIPIDIKITKERNPLFNYCGIDLGIRTFATEYGNSRNAEFYHNDKQMKKLNNKIDKLKCEIKYKLKNKIVIKNDKRVRKRVRKRKFIKIEKKKKNVIDELHWKTINNILKENDYIFCGDIKSHNIVRRNKNHKLNRDFNDLKFYQFKQRLQYKASLISKKIFLVNEFLTTKTCSSCGNVREVGVSKIYKCKKCKLNVDRDMNSAKNILMKGIINEIL